MLAIEFMYVNTSVIYIYCSPKYMASKYGARYIAARTMNLGTVNVKNVLCGAPYGFICLILFCQDFYYLKLW